MNIYFKSFLIATVAAVITTFLYRVYSKQEKIIAEAVDKITNEQKYDLDFTCTIEKNDTISPAITMQAIESRASLLSENYEIKKTGLLNFSLKVLKVADTSFTKKLLFSSTNLSFQPIYGIDKLAPLFENINRLSKKELDNKNESPSTDKLTEQLAHKKNTFADIFFSKVQFNQTPITTSEGIAYAPGLALVMIKDTAWVDSLFSGREFIANLPADLKFFYGKSDDDRLGSYYNTDSTRKITLYAIQVKKTNLIDNLIEKAYMDFDKGTSMPTIEIKFNQKGAALFASFTEDNIHKNIAMIAGGYVLTAPMVTSKIENGLCSISGNFSILECDHISKQISAGILPGSVAVETKVFPLKMDKTSIFNANNWVNTFIVFFVSFFICFFASFLIFKNLQPS